MNGIPYQNYSICTGQTSISAGSSITFTAVTLDCNGIQVQCVAFDLDKNGRLNVSARSCNATLSVEGMLVQIASIIAIANYIIMHDIQSSL